jgi:glycosyltransferase involved in cell wall biosynthesis
MGCEKFKTHCGRCPILGSKHNTDLSSWTFKRKKKYFEAMDIHVVAPSEWLAQEIKQSSLFKKNDVSVIRNGIDMDIYKPVSRKKAREQLNLPYNKKIILFGAENSTHDPRKGFTFLMEALKKLKSHNDSYFLAVFGASGNSEIDMLPFPTRFFGHIHDESQLSLLYSSADVFVAPSKQETFCNTVLESLACGTPAVVFDASATPELISHRRDGYIAKAFDSQDLCEGIVYCLNNSILGKEARKKVEKSYSLNTFAQKYIRLYESVLGQ